VLFSGWMPMIWLLLAVGLGILEAATVDLVAIWFALGSLVAVVPALLGAPFWAQLLVFLAISLISLVFTRPMVKDVLKVKKTSTNADQIIGMVGLVTEPISNVEGKGRVQVNGLGWAARSDDGAPILAQESVLIKAIEGVTVIVERVI
ncbi:MAG: NfeD family protein, partial [Oscillospiraceae bacterium]